MYTLSAKYDINKIVCEKSVKDKENNEKVIKNSFKFCINSTMMLGFISTINVNTELGDGVTHAHFD